jgi:hypothetical protein
LTADEAKPDAKGSTEKLERWVEFVKGKNVVAREVVSIVPAAEAKLVQKDTPPPSGGSKVRDAEGGDYVRVWFNRAATTISSTSRANARDVDTLGLGPGNRAGERAKHAPSYALCLGPFPLPIPSPFP